MIIEERGLKFEEDLFTFHELMMMKNVFNYAYKDYILSINKWIKKFGYRESNVSLSGYYPDSKISWKLRLANWGAYVAQVLYMILLNHKPNLEKIKKENKEGKIQFYRPGFKEEKLKLINSI